MNIAPQRVSMFRMDLPNAEPSGPSVDPLAPIAPSEAVRAELAAFLEADDSRLGDVYRGLQRGLTADEIAAELGVPSIGFVWSYNRIVRVLLDADLPTAPSVATAVARRFRSILRANRLSPAAQTYLNLTLVELERRANDEVARVVEVEKAKEHTEAAEALNEVGIYVYALPHYLRYPFDPETGRTLMKVGRSDSDVIQRFRNQTRTTALPEEPILLRIYKTEASSSATAEADFHGLLQSAAHYRSVARTAGREWFLTSTEFLDEIARVMRLERRVVNDSAMPEED